LLRRNAASRRTLRRSQPSCTWGQSRTWSAYSVSRATSQLWAAS
jgi:hypothetical protein